MEKKRPGSAHLEIVVNDAGKDAAKIEGYADKVLYAWMKLTVLVAQAVKIPLTELFALGAVMGPEVEEAHRCAEGCRIDLSRREE